MDLMRTDAPTCGLRDRVGDVRERVEKADWNLCVVVNEERIVFGLLRAKQLAAGDDEVVEKVMRPGPSTFRPNVPAEHMAHYMIEHDLESALITVPEGKLLGVLRREDAARVALELHQHHEEGNQE